MTSARFPAVPWLNCHYMLGIFHGALLTPSSTHIGGARHRATGLGVPCARNLSVSVRRRYRCWLYGPAVSQLLSQPGTLYEHLMLATGLCNAFSVACRGTRGRSHRA